jgi:triosephosphate isomerase
MNFFLKFPLFLINFKCFNEIIGERSIEISRYAKEISDKLNVCIAIAPIATNLKEISKIIITFAQSADPIEPGSYTGHIPIEAIKEAGAKGIIINHSEKRIDKDKIKFLIDKSKKLNIISLACGISPEECLEISYFKPNIIAIEPPELIGTGKSVSKYKPESVKRTLELIKGYDKSIKVLCGAGISNKEDVEEALKLGSEGVLVASSIVKSKNPYETIYEMAKVLREYS